MHAHGWRSAYLHQFVFALGRCRHAGRENIDLNLILLQRPASRCHREGDPFYDANIRGCTISWPDKTHLFWIFRRIFVTSCCFSFWVGKLQLRVFPTVVSFHQTFGIELSVLFSFQFISVCISWFTCIVNRNEMPKPILDYRKYHGIDLLPLDLADSMSAKLLYM